MKNRIFGGLLVSLGSAMLGFCGGYFVAHKRAFDAADEMATRDIEEFKAFLTAKNDATIQREIDRLNAEFGKEGGSEEENTPVSEDQKPKKTCKKAKNDENPGPKEERLIVEKDASGKIAYHSFGKPSIDDAMKDVTRINGVPVDQIDDLEAFLEGQEESLRHLEETKDQSQPVFISEEEFNQEKENFDKLSITYWAADSIFSDDRDNVIDDPVAIFGQYGVDTIETTDLGEVLYLRNYGMACDYEVIIVGKSYSGNILGLDEDGEPLENMSVRERFADKPRKEPVKRRKKKAE